VKKPLEADADAEEGNALRDSFLDDVAESVLFKEGGRLEVSYSGKNDFVRFSHDFGVVG